MTPLRRRLIALAGTVESARASALRLSQGKLGVLTPSQWRARIKRLLSEAQNDIRLIIEDIELEDTTNE